MPSNIKTRFLIVSDTHGKNFVDRVLNPNCDVAIHCGDLTDGSTLEEFQATIRQLLLIQAPLKLVIAGNHDFTMDMSAFERKVADAVQPIETDLLAQTYGCPGEARRLFEDAKDAGIVFLEEGNHHFTLTNGAQLNVFASPCTPSMGQWGFQYNPNKGHRFEIDEHVDIAITHGPPRGILDHTYGKERAGCPDLFAAVANARPRLHCFGHIHEGWGARLVTWKEGIEGPTHFTAIDNVRSTVIENLAGLRAGKFDTVEDIGLKEDKVRKLEVDKFIETSHCQGTEHYIHHGEQTLFVNASIEGSEDFQQRPWIVELDLPAASTTDSKVIEETGIREYLTKRSNTQKKGNGIYKLNLAAIDASKKERWNKLDARLIAQGKDGFMEHVRKTTGSD